MTAPEATECPHCHRNTLRRQASRTCTRCLACYIDDLPDRLAAAEVRLEAVKALAEKWRYKGEFGWGAWQEGHGPDEEGYILDQAAAEIRAALSGEAS
jgi:hypothetical protein